MFTVIKRDGRREEVSFDAILKRNKEMSKGLVNVDAVSLSQYVIKGLKNEMTTEEIDTLSAEQCLAMSIYEPTYSVVASRLTINNLHKRTRDSMSEYIKDNEDMLDQEVSSIMLANIDLVDSEIKYEKDYNLPFFGIKTLEKSYLLRKKYEGDNVKITERPQQLFMRCAFGLHRSNVQKALETYRHLSDLEICHATPTLFHGGTRIKNLSSCFLLSTEDSIEGIADTIKDCMIISKNAGGIGMDITPIRGNGATIESINGVSSGIIPFIKIFNEVSRAVDQAGKRKGAMSISLQLWHEDIFPFLEMVLNTTIEERRVHDIFPALWIPDIFFKRLKENGNGNDIMWSLFCPAKFPELIRMYGQEFEDRYLDLERQGKYKRQVPIRDVWMAICRSLEEKGLPYMLSKDNVNKKSNQSNIGAITSSNLCVEIMEYNTPESIASCNLASVCLSSCIKTISSDSEDDTVTNIDRYMAGFRSVQYSDKSLADEPPAFFKAFDFEKLAKLTSILVENLNNIIDAKQTPLKKTEVNNQTYRPIAVGVQGLADVFFHLDIAWGTEQSTVLNKLIFQTMYYAALKKSCELAKLHGAYSSFSGSPLSKGIFHFEMKDTEKEKDIGLTFLDWKSLRKDVVEHGVRNSLMIALMPTNSTSIIMGNVDCFEPITSNIYTKKTLTGTYPLANKFLYEDLNTLGLWNRENVEEIIRNNGSVQTLDISDALKSKYKTVWEIPQSVIVKMAADRQNFIDQSQSMNIYMTSPTLKKLSSLYIDAWSKGLKSLSYYVRSRAAADATQYSISIKKTVEKKSAPKKSSKVKPAVMQCDDEICLSCQ